MLRADDRDSRMAGSPGLDLSLGPDELDPREGYKVQRKQKERNVGTAERWVRVIGGAVLAFVGLAYLLAGAGSVLAVVIGAALILLGADFVFTGITGYCPLYNRLGWSTARTRERSKRERLRPR